MHVILLNFLTSPFIFLSLFLSLSSISVLYFLISRVHIFSPSVFLVCASFSLYQAPLCFAVLYFVLSSRLYSPSFTLIFVLLSSLSSFSLLFFSFLFFVLYVVSMFLLHSPSPILLFCCLIFLLFLFFFFILCSSFYFAAHSLVFSISVSCNSVIFSYFFIYFLFYCGFSSSYIIFCTSILRVYICTYGAVFPCNLSFYSF